MSKRRLSVFLTVGVCGVLVMMAVAPAQPVKLPKELNPPVVLPKPLVPSNEVIQTFPSNDLPKTAWKVHWATASGYGLYIQDAWFKKSMEEPWMQVLGDARLSEAFVPYHRGSPRFWDISYNFPLCTVTREDAGPFGQLLSTSPGKDPTVVKEVRDRGLMWKDARGVRRGQRLVLWGTLSAANYRYVIEYGFQDDGTINFNVGSTGHNYGGSEWTGHMHNSLWRIDVNLDGPNHNSVLLCEHIEPDGDQKAKAKGVTQSFNDGVEGFADWDANKFTTLRVIHTQKKNVRGQPISYEIMPKRMGNARHFGGGKEECTQHDFWVTRANPKELQYPRVQEYVKNQEKIEDTDIVLWYTPLATTSRVPRTAR